MSLYRLALLPVSALLIAALAAPGTADAKRRRERKQADAQLPAEIDPLALATVMLRDRHFDRAAAVLEEAVPGEGGVEPERYWMLLGLVNLERGHFAKAVSNLEEALRAGQADPMVQVFLAQARFGDGDIAGALRALDDGKEAAASLEGTHLLRAQCHLKLEDKRAAYLAVARGLSLHPDSDELARYRVLLLVDLGLFCEALEQGTSYLERPGAGPLDYLALSQALLEGGQAEQAVLVLEIGRLRYPGEEDISLQLARAYLETGKVLTAARLFRAASRRNPALAADAAELFRKGGRPAHALFLNAEVSDQKSKVRQRLALLIDLGRCEEAAGLGPRLSRLGLLEEDQVIYALAYALFQSGRFEEAEAHLSRISTPDLFEKALELRRAMDRCRAEGWRCH